MNPQPITHCAPATHTSDTWRQNSNLCSSGSSQITFSPETSMSGQHLRNQATFSTFLTSEGHSALLPTNAHDHDCDKRWHDYDAHCDWCLLRVLVFSRVFFPRRRNLNNKSLNDWFLGKQWILFPLNFDVSRDFEIFLFSYFLKKKWNQNNTSSLGPKQSKNKPTFNFGLFFFSFNFFFRKLYGPKAYGHISKFFWSRLYTIYNICERGYLRIHNSDPITELQLYCSFTKDSHYSPSSNMVSSFFLSVLEFYFKSGLFCLISEKDDDLSCAMKFSQELNFADCRFFAFRGTNFDEFGFQTLPLGTNFRGSWFFTNGTCGTGVTILPLQFNGYACHLGWDNHVKCLY